MISSSLHLSSDLRRLGFIRLFVWLTTNRSRISNDILKKNYREIISKNRIKNKWNIHPETGIKSSGSGMGLIEKPVSKDPISKNHLDLAKNLDFVRFDRNAWAQNGYLLASLKVDVKGNPFFFKDEFRKKEYKNNGFIFLDTSESCIFLNSIFRKDFDRLIPILRTLYKKSKRTDIALDYLQETTEWLKIRMSHENNYNVKRQYNNRIIDYNNKYERLQKELNETNIDDLINDDEQNKPFKRRFKVRPRLDKKEKKSVKLYCREQTSPRLEFLMDLKILQKINGGIEFTKMGGNIYQNCIEPLYKNYEKYNKLYDKTNDYIYEVIIPNYHYNLNIDINEDMFHTILNQVIKFYGRSSALIMPFYDVYLSVMSKMVKLNMFLYIDYFHDLLMDNYKNTLEVSTSGRGSKYIKKRANL